MSEVKRYVLENRNRGTWPYQEPDMYEADYGDWVKEEDFAALRLQLTQAEQRIAELERGVITARDQIQAVIESLPGEV